MLNKVRTYIETHHLLEDFQPVAVALSGGADSVALLHILHRLGYEVTALHCNFHLRGPESDRDQHFVEQLCQDLNIPLKVKHFDTRQYAKDTGKSIEMAARDLRYQWFAEESHIEHSTSNIAHRTSYIPLAVAHHQDDQAETILLNLIRGTGLRGLRGMLPQSTIPSCHPEHSEGSTHILIRPLLCVNRQEILDYLDQEHLPHVEDSTNQDTHIRRNLIRHQLIPLLRQLNPSIVNTLSEESLQFQDYYQLAQERLEQFNAEGLSNLSPKTYLTQDIARHSACETILYNLLHPYGFQPDVVRQLARVLQGIGNGRQENLSGKCFLSPTHTAEIHRGQLLIYPRDTSPTSKTSSTSNTSPTSPIRKNIDRASLEPITFPAPNALEALFDADKLSGDLTLRHWKLGDTFAPFGMHGRRQKISDYFTDHHFSRRQKEETLLLLCDQEIAWIVGHRTSDLFRIDSATRTVARISLA